MEDQPLQPEASAEFDPHARGYRRLLDGSMRFARESTDELARMKVELMLAATRRLLGRPRDLSMLDVGCGIGVAEPFLAPHVKRVVGGDVSANMLDEARAACPGVEFVQLPPSGMPFGDATFDVQFCYCVYHHVPPRSRRAWVAELARVVRPGGLLFVFEHNPFNPVTRRIVSTCPLDRDAVLLRPSETRDLLTGAGLQVVEQRYYLFFPKLLGFLRSLEPWLGWLPLGGQYYVAARRPR